MELRDYLKSGLQHMNSYKIPHVSAKYRLNINESPFAPSEEVRRKLCGYIMNANLNLYPDTDSLALRTKIAERFGLTRENIICTVGSDELIDIVTKTFLNPGEKVAVPAPTFSLYGLFAVQNGGGYTEVPLNKDGNSFKYEPDKLIEAANNPRNFAKILFICSPNNPTGNALPIKDIEYILKNVRIPVFLDEAYHEFSGEESAVRLINTYENLIVSRTFSKAYGFAGVRAGYGAASVKMIALLDIVRPPYNLSSLTQQCAEIILNDADEVIARANYLISERDRVFAELSNMKTVTAYKSAANFIYFENARDVCGRLLERGVHIKNCGYAGGGTAAARVSIGIKEANDAFLSALKEIDNEDS